jgi:hypothetical protein
MGIQLNKNIEWEDGSDNTSGIQTKLLVAKMSDILTFPKPVLDDSTGDGEFENLVTITGNFVMKPYKKFIELYVTLETGELKHESQGELDGISFLNQLEFLIPGSKKQVLGFTQWAKNSSLCFIVTEADGQQRVLGHPGYPAKMVSAPGTTGKAPADRKSSTFTFKSSRKGPAPVFEGKIDLTGSGFSEGDTDDFQTIFSD